MTEQSQWGEGMPYATHDAYLTRHIGRSEWALPGKEEKQERSRMAVVLRQMPRDKDVLGAKEAARLKNPRASAYVAWNLQYLPAAVNTSKSNNWPPPGYLDWAGHHDNEPRRAAVAGEWGGFGEEYYD
jgi:hypothetical protein